VLLSSLHVAGKSTTRLGINLNIELCGWLYCLLMVQLMHHWKLCLADLTTLVSLCSTDQWIVANYQFMHNLAWHMIHFTTPNFVWAKTYAFEITSSFSINMLLTCLTFIFLEISYHTFYSLTSSTPSLFSSLKVETQYNSHNLHVIVRWNVKCFLTNHTWFTEYLFNMFYNVSLNWNNNNMFLSTPCHI
jgi:hypothetical protein